MRCFTLVVLVLSYASAQSPCELAAAATSGLLGAFAPSCEPDGSFSPNQCHASTGHCWCVDPQGTEILGTRRAPGLDLARTCDQLPQCLLDAHTGRHSGLLGAFVPQCNADGSFSTTQCHASTGQCYCALEGIEVPLTRRSPGEPQLDCDNLPACLLAAATPSTLLGSHTPQCSDDGSFLPEQCHGSTGSCWCVDTSGAEIEGTRRGPSQPRLDCSAVPHCLVQAHAAASSPLLGAFSPSCQPDGSFSQTQCHSSTGHCWCVDPSGSEILGTRYGPSDTALDCHSVPTCLLAAHATAHATPPATPPAKKTLGAKLGAFVPQCDATGEYSPQQCHGSTGFCWCVSSNGAEIEGTRRGPGQPRVDCDNIPPCLLAVANAQPMIGAFVAQCDSDGQYAPQQCHGSTGHCWCIDQDGLEIEGTRSGPTDTRVDCGSVPDCLLRSHTARATHLIGAFTPQCSADGSYNPRQTHGSTGLSFCVDASGTEITGTRSPPGTAPPIDCAAVPPCVTQRHEAHGLLGAFAPQCDSEGAFLPMQCHGSTGHCFCVDSEGVEIANSRRTPTETGPDCTHEDSPCRVAARRAQSAGGVAPECDDTGAYSPVQCNTMANTCFCVDREGAEIQGTSVSDGAVPACSDIDPCLMHAHNARGRGAMVGQFVPQCQEAGGYAEVQCHASTGYCWCVTPTTGAAVPGTFLRGQPDCSHPDDTGSMPPSYLTPTDDHTDDSDNADDTDPFGVHTLNVSIKTAALTLSGLAFACFMAVQIRKRHNHSFRRHDDVPVAAPVARTRVSAM